MAANFGKESTNDNLVVLCLFLVLIPFTSAARGLIMSDQNLEVQEHLKGLNKPPIKSIQSPDGDIIDCVLAANQPAFDHPQLKNHVIQMTPSFHPEGVFEDGVEKKGAKPNIIQMWHDMNESCPDGSVAIRRTKQEDLLRAISLQKYGRKKPRTIPQLTTTNDVAPASPTSHHEYAVMGVESEEYYGTQAYVSLWQPKLEQPNEFSLSQLWITAGSYELDDLNSIETGWQVYPYLYGDNSPRFFTYWTMDAYKTTGCYNLLCSGFVQTSNKIALGAALSPVSVYNGVQYGYTILVWKDTNSGNWWLKFEDEHIGYWPSSLFTYLAKSASRVKWGGEIFNSETGGKHTTTEMGSGHYSREGDGRASYFTNILIVDGTNTLKEPTGILLFVDHPKCYNLLNGYAFDSGTYFYYGGPGGGNPNCL